MKIKLLTISLLIFTSYALFAQKGTASTGIAKEKSNFGLKFGSNATSQSLEYDNSLASPPFALKTSSLTSFHVGVFGEFILSKKIELKSEILYSKEGFKMDIGVVNFIQSLDYIKVPVITKFKPFANNFSVLAGPQFGFLINDNVDLGGVLVQVIDDSFKDFEVSAILGFEYDVTNRFIIGVRYNFGLTENSNDKAISYKSNNFQTYLGFRLF